MSISEELLARFEWIDGHADIWRLFTDQTFFSALVGALADPFRDAGITKVAGIEARGFVLRAGVALELRAGFVAIRKEGGLFPGEMLTAATRPDYRGNSTVLRLQQHALTKDDHVLLVDDGFETGSQALSAKSLIEEVGAEFAGASVIVDQLDAQVRPPLPHFAALIPADALGPSA